MKFVASIDASFMALALLFPAGQASASLDPKRVYFPEGRPRPAETFVELESFLSPEEKQSLQDLRQALVANPMIGVEVRGNVDRHECEPSECYDLSVHRAKVVYDWLHSHGVRDEQLAGPVGESVNFQVDSGDTEEGRGFNRRIEFGAFVLPQIKS